MSETIFLTKQEGNIITVVNKNAAYVVGTMRVEDDKYIIEGELKPICHLNDALEKLVRNASKVD